MSNCLLPIYRNTIDFLKLTLYSATLLNSFFSSSSIFVDFLVLYTQLIISSLSKDNFTPSFPVCMLFIPFSCLITLVRTPSTILSRANWTYLKCTQVKWVHFIECKLYLLKQLNKDIIRLRWLSCLDSLHKQIKT